MVPQQLRRTLTLWDGMALAIGSIAGSGILYLPSLTYVLAGQDVLLVWLGGTLLALPMLFMFADMVRLVPDGSGIEGFVAYGLGAHMAATVPLLFLSVVVLGIPAGVLVAGEYLRAALGGGRVVQLVGALAILAVAIATNLAGAAVGARVQRRVSWALLLVVVALCALSGLFQLAERIRPAWLATGVIAVFALTVMQLNAASWLWGMSRLVHTSA